MKVMICRGTDRRVISEAVEAIRNGDIIIYPTDTLYAFGCDALNNRAIERLCRLKGLNPDKNLLSVVCADISQAAEYARVDNRAFKHLKTYLPGPYTFILPAATKLPKVFKGRKSVGIRIPDNAIARAIAEELGNPVMSSSVHVPDDADELAEMTDPHALALKYEGCPDIAFAIDGGEGGTVGSTIVDLLQSDTPTLLRQGAGEFESED